MNTEQALNLLKTVCSIYKGTLEEHQSLQTALQVIRANLVAEKVEEVETEKTA